MFGKKSKIISRTTRRELREFINENFEKRLGKNKIKKLKNSTQCKEWKTRERAGLNEGTQRRSCYLGPGTP